MMITRHVLRLYFSLRSFTDLSPQVIITMTRIIKSHSWLLYGCLMYPDKEL